MKALPCSTVIERIDDYSRHDLAAEQAADIDRHLLACSSCEDAGRQAGRADHLLDAVRGDDLLAEVGEPQLRWMRTRILAAVQEERSHERPRLFGFAVGSAFAALLLVGLVGLMTATVLPKPDMMAAAPVAEELNVVTVSTPGGVTLRWQGTAAAYTILKSTGAGSQDRTETTVVCGTTWTDRDAAPGLVVYRVVPAHERCRA